MPATQQQHKTVAKGDNMAAKTTTKGASSKVSKPRKVKTPEQRAKEAFDRKVLGAVADTVSGTYGAGAYLTMASKMPGCSWSLPAGRTCPGSKVAAKLHGEASTCAMCYAKEGNYRYDNVRAAQDKRLQFVLDSLRNDAGETWVSTTIAAIRAAVSVTGDPYFRVHDSGDLFSPAYAYLWVRVCKALPSVRFWFPTREWVRPAMQESLAALAALPNVQVKPSALRVNDAPPAIEGLGGGTMVAMYASDVPEDVVSCPATMSTTEKRCDMHGCRRCWTGARVAYLAHGQEASKARKSLPVL